MAKTTWRDAIKEVCKSIPSLDEIDPNTFLSTLREHGVEVHEDIAKSFETLQSDEQKRKVARLLCDLANLDTEPNLDKRREDYAKLAGYFESLFAWEEDEAPGWFFIP